MFQENKIYNQSEEAKLISEERQRFSLQIGRIYALRNEEDLVVGVGREGRYFLYHRPDWESSAWIVNMPIAFEVDNDGRILTSRGEVTSWNVLDLVDSNNQAERELNGRQ